MAGTTNRGTWTNADGLHVIFASAAASGDWYINKLRAVDTDGLVKEVVYDYDLTKIPTGKTAYTYDNNNDGTNDCFGLGDVFLPANASVLDVVVLPTVTAVGGTSFTLGTYQLNGTAISANSLVTATEAVTANLGIGTLTRGAGALNAYTVAETGTAGVGSVDGYVAMTVTGTFTAGKGRILIRYIDPLED